MNILIDVIIYNHNAETSYFTIPFSTLVQILLSVGIPLLVFGLGAKSSNNKERKKEFSRLVTLKEYYLMWASDIVKFSKIQTNHYKDYALGLYKLDHLHGVQYNHVDLMIEKIKSVDDKDLYKVFIDLFDGTSASNAEMLIKFTKRLQYIDVVTTQLRKEHNDFLIYQTELRNNWNKQVTNLHSVKHRLTSNVVESNAGFAEFKHLINLEFNKWYRTIGKSKLRTTYRFLLELNEISQRYYRSIPDDVGEMLFAVQDLIITYKMFVAYRLEVFKKFKEYYQGLSKSTEDLEQQITFLKTSKIKQWKHIPI